MVKNSKNLFIKFIFLVSIIALVSAFFIEYILGHQPCILCILERIPYFLTIIIVLLNYKLIQYEKFFIFLLIIIFLAGTVLSLYHLGIEQGIISESSICASNNINLITKDEILSSLQEIRISCKDVAFRIFDLSLTTYNMILSIIMFLISMKIYIINNGIKK